MNGSFEGEVLALRNRLDARSLATRKERSARLLSLAAGLWFVVAALGQWLFVAYILGFYGRAVWSGQLEDFNQVLPRGITPGDSVGNAVVVVHVLLASVVMAGGTLQLLPAIRRRWPRLHRWNGRLYLSAVLLVALAGVTMVLAREGGPSVLHVGILLNALVVLACAVQALRHAVARRIDQHRRWALRLFLAASAVWFFRIGLMFWLLVNQGPVGFDPETFRGPFLVFLGYAQTLLPLAVLELYFRARDGGSRGFRWAMAAVLAACAGATATGIFAAAMMLWLPRL